MRTRIKICGITRPADGVEAARLGADAVGLVFYPPSPRAVSIGQARAVVDALPPFVTTVALFVDPSEAQVREVCDAVPIDLVQYHGDEPPELCEALGHPFIKVIRMREGVDLAAEARRYHKARALLLDTYRPGVPGGTGEAFAWERVPRDLPLPVVLAGGLTPDNVAEAVARVRPFAVDVSGGVEAEKGVKDAARMAAFIRGVNRAETD